MNEHSPKSPKIESKMKDMTIAILKNYQSISYQGYPSYANKGDPFVFDT